VRGYIPLELPVVEQTGVAPEKIKVGLDLEAVPQVSWDQPPTHKHGLSIAWGMEGEDMMAYTAALDRRPGRFNPLYLKMVRATLIGRDVVVVGHNVLRYDLPFLNGILIQHDLEPLPALRCIDTMGNFKTGYAYRNSLRAQCERYGVQLKQGSPDWDKILMGDKDEWALLKDYNVNDVVCTLQLERKLAEAGLRCPIKEWRPRR
jgi:hypothetical protein